MINSYSYTPYMLDEDNTIKEYHNDDMYIQVDRNRQYDRIYYEIYGCAYDGSWEVGEIQESRELAIMIFDYIVENYADTPPAEGDIELYIEQVNKGLIYCEALAY